MKERRRDIKKYISNPTYAYTEAHYSLTMHLTSREYVPKTTTWHGFSLSWKAYESHFPCRRNTHMYFLTSIVDNDCSTSFWDDPWCDHILLKVWFLRI